MSARSAPAASERQSVSTIFGGSLKMKDKSPLFFSPPFHMYGDAPSYRQGSVSLPPPYDERRTAKLWTAIGVVLALMVAFAALGVSVYAIVHEDDSKEHGRHSPTSEHVRHKQCNYYPCHNGGTCVPLEHDDYVCVCNWNHFGEHCQFKKDEANTHDSFFMAVMEMDKHVPWGHLILWDTVSYDLGRNYNTTFAGYVAPATGYYQFSISQASDTKPGFVLLIDGHPYSRHEASGNEGQLSVTVTIHMYRLECLQVFNLHGNVTLGRSQTLGLNSWFSGHLLFTPANE